MDLNGVQVAPFGSKLGQNVAPSLRIIFQALLGPEILLKNPKAPKHKNPFSGLYIRRPPRGHQAAKSDLQSRFPTSPTKSCAQCLDSLTSHVVTMLLVTWQLVTMLLVGPGTGFLPSPDSLA